jgi:type III restriction enzyme
LRYLKILDCRSYEIEYINYKGAIAYYYPDFVAEQKVGKKAIMWLIETKGREKEDVSLKDARTEKWCKDATKLTGVDWCYLKVPYNPYLGITKNLTSMPYTTFDEFLGNLKKLLSDNQVKLNV